MEKFYFFHSFLDTARAIEDDKLRAEYLMAVAEYGLEGKESDNPMVKALMVQTQFVLDRSKELSQLKSECMKWNKNAVKTWGKQWKQRKTEKNSDKQKKQEEEVEEEVEIEVEEENKKKEKNTKKKFLDFVKLTDEEYEKLITQFWQQWADEKIKHLNNYIGSKWDKYKSHYFTILSWDRNDTWPKTHNGEIMKERARQRIREEAQAILNPKQNDNGQSIQDKWVDWRASIAGC